MEGTSSGIPTPLLHHGIKSITPSKKAPGGWKPERTWGWSEQVILGQVRATFLPTRLQTTEPISVADPKLHLAAPFTLCAVEGPRLPEARTSGSSIPTLSLTGWVTLNLSLFPPEPHFPYL